MNKKVVIIGASGHGKVIADIIIKSGDSIIGFLDDNPNLGDTFIGYPVLGKIELYKEYKLQNEFVIAIGNAAIRKKIAEAMDVNWYTAIHPTAVVSMIDVVVQSGSVIMANAVINPGTRIGKHCIINTSAVVEHDNIIEDYVHVSVGVKLAGTVQIGKMTWIGIGATIKNNISICSECVIGAGAVVVKDIKEPGVYIGVPVKKSNNNY